MDGDKDRIAELLPTNPLPPKLILLLPSVYQMAFKPGYRLHVVHFEADHAATADDVITSCLLARHAKRYVWSTGYNTTLDPKIIRRKEYLIAQASSAAIAKCRNKSDPFIDAATLEEAVVLGILDVSAIGRKSIRKRTNPSGFD